MSLCLYIFTIRYVHCPSPQQPQTTRFAKYAAAADYAEHTLNHAV